MFFVRSEDYARRYQWPNAFCPSPTYFVSKANKTWHGKFVLESVEDYAHRGLIYSLIISQLTISFRLPENASGMGKVRCYMSPA